ncbi:acylneuraminate cytidylyltransferase family protein [Parapedobacter sp. ISTM3]|uniref:acylneuraminate cytidylyltransferase family protein n=1 Tax=Parapedobacter sp. ISTM3 TaxID=2800130 RepID=UPI0019051768|nr:acylneuraminate cytidylyltransferase family protein [Parapedobacter sp. ISTM3]MBK1438366.1 acylneuraminate cytidylyltransferase family protein [Parapedobacter sp. ISTM3]
MNILYLIPARGGSKGVPHKNIHPLAGKPLIYYTVKAAMEVSSNKNIYLSTDSPQIKQIAEEMGLSVPFLRPKELSGDDVSSEAVLLHAIQAFRDLGRNYDYIVMLQPTSPLRKPEHIKEALSLVTPESELIVSVKITDANPYYVLFEEDNDGILRKAKEGVFIRRQDCPTVYELNGAIYIINVEKLLAKGYQQLAMTKYLMKRDESIDIDTMLDFKLAELILNA